MSRRNKVNKDRYTMAGRLTPDDWARERRKQTPSLFGESRRRGRQPQPPWMANEAAVPGEGEDGDETATAAEPIDAENAASMNPDLASEAAQQPEAKSRSASRGKQQPGGGNKKKTSRRKATARKQETRTGTTRGARSAKAKKRATPKTSARRTTQKVSKAKKSAAKKSAKKKSATKKSAKKKGAKRRSAKS